MKYLHSIILAVVLFSCKSVTKEVKILTMNCKDLPEFFTSYEMAIIDVKNTHFTVNEKITNVDGKKGAWGKSISFLSCDGGKTGFLLLYTDKKEYLFQEFPDHKWKYLKESNNWGWFFEHELKGNFPVKIYQVIDEKGVASATLQEEIKYENVVLIDPEKMKLEMVAAKDKEMLEKQAKELAETKSVELAKQKENALNIVSSEPVYHKVVYGNKLYSLAKLHGTTVDAIVALNKLKNPHFIKIDQVIRIK